MKDKTSTTLETVKVEFVSALKGYYKAKEALTKAFLAAVPVICGKTKNGKARKLLRETLIAWALEAGIAKKTAGNTVSALMLANGLSIRHRQKSSVTEEQEAMVAELLEFCGEHIDADELVAVLRIALERVRNGEGKTEVKAA